MNLERQTTIGDEQHDAGAWLERNIQQVHEAIAIIDRVLAWQPSANGRGINRPKLNVELVCNKWDFPHSQEPFVIAALSVAGSKQRDEILKAARAWLIERNDTYISQLAMLQERP